MKKILSIISLIQAIKSTIAYSSLIKKEFPYMIFSTKDKISEELNLYFNMSNTINPVIETTLIGAKISRPFSQLASSPKKIIDETCILKDSLSKTGLLYICGQDTVILVQSFDSFRSVKLRFPDPSENVTRIQVCKSAFFVYNETTVKGFYVVCFMNDISPEPKTQNELKTIVFFYDLENNFVSNMVYEFWDFSFEGNIKGVYKEREGLKHALLYQEDNNKLLLYFRVIDDDYLKLETLPFNILVTFDDVIVKDIAAVPNNLNKKSDFIVISCSAKDKKILKGFFVRASADKNDAIIEKFLYDKEMKSEIWSYFIDEKYVYEVNILGFEQEKLDLDLTIKNNIVLKLGDIMTQTGIHFDKISMKGPVEKIRFFHTQNATAIQIFNHPLHFTISYFAVFDKIYNSLMFNSLDKPFFSFGPIDQNLIFFRTDNGSVLTNLGRSFILFNLPAVKKNTPFQSQLILTEGPPQSPRESTAIDLNGMVILDLDTFVEAYDMDTLPLNLYNNIPISLPIDTNKIRGSNLDFNPLNLLRYHQMDTGILSKFDKVNFESFLDDCELMLIDQWLVYIRTDDRKPYNRLASVYEVINIQKDGFELEEKSKSPIIFEKSYDYERVVKNSRQGRYLVFLTIVLKDIKKLIVDHYNLYIAYEPNFVYKIQRFDMSSMAIEMIPNTEIENSKTIKLFVVDSNKNEIRIYKVNAEDQQEMELLQTMNKENILGSFCPVDIKRGIINPGYLIISSQCKDSFNFYIYNFKNGVIEYEMNLENKDKYSMCMFYDQILMKTEKKNLLYGKKVSFFEENYISYSNPIDITNISDFYCSISTKSVIVKKRDEDLKKATFIIYKGPNSYSFDLRIYKILEFDLNKFQKIRTYEFKENYLFFCKNIKNRWEVFQLKMDGPSFELKTIYPESYFPVRTDMIEGKVSIEVKGKNSKKSFDVPLRVFKAEFHPYSVTKKSEVFYTNKTSIDAMLDLKGHHYRMKIEPSFNEPNKNLVIKDEEISVSYYDILKTIKLSSQIRFQIDFISRSPEFILGYHIYNGIIYIMDLELNYITKIEVNYQCTVGDHTSLENSKILIMVGCKVDNAMKLLSYVVDFGGEQKETIKPDVIGSYNIGIFTNVKVYKMTQDRISTFLIRVDFEDFSYVNLYKYSLDAKSEDNFAYQELDLFRTLSNCTSFTSVGSIGYRVFFFTNQHVYDKIQYIVFRQESTFRISSEKYLDIKGELGLTLYSDSVYCSSLDEKGTNIKCVLINKGIDFYEISIDFINGSPPKMTLVGKTPYRKYYDFQIEDFKISEKFIVFQGVSKSLGNERSILLYKRKTENDDSIKNEPGYLYFALSMKLFKQDCYQKTKIELKGADEAIILSDKKDGKDQIIFQKIKFLDRVVDLTRFKNELKYQTFNITFLNPLNERKEKDSYNFGQLFDNDETNKTYIHLNFFLLCVLLIILIAATFVAVKKDYLIKKNIKDEYKKSFLEEEENEPEFSVVRLKSKRVDSTDYTGKVTISIESSDKTGYSRGDSYF